MVEKLKKTPVVTVSVLAGVVAFQFGEATGLLKAGMSQVFGKKGQTKGVVVSTTDLSVTLKVGKEAKETFYTARNNKLQVLNIGTLLEGDELTITWAVEEGKKWITRMTGEGNFTGKVVEKGKAWIRVKDHKGNSVRFRPEWIGGMPAR